MKTQKLSTQTITLIAIFVALLAIFSQIAIPLPSGVPATLQTFGIALIAYLLKCKKGMITIFVYLFCGLVGIPVFAGFSSGLSCFFGKAGGFLYGFFFLVFFCGLATQTNTTWKKITLSALGLIACHMCGVLQFAFLMHMSIFSSFLLVSLPFLLKDALSMVGAFFLSKLILKALTQSGIQLHTLT